MPPIVAMAGTQNDDWFIIEVEKSCDSRRAFAAGSLLLAWLDATSQASKISHR